ncbi:MAG: hypothetical protein EB127_07300 [Alphaproteobacteria bacterium]|nr:hypothetical protein [Alphaproteobacteria bacterium]
MNNVQIIGAGVWGLALGLVLSRKNNIELVARSESRAEELKQMKLRGDLPDNIHISTSLKSVANYTIIATPANAISDIIENNLKDFSLKPNIVIASKGMDPKSSDFLSSALEKHNLQPLILCGPNFASELLAGKKAATNIAAKDFARAKSASITLATEDFQIYPLEDYITLQICGCYKNILSIYCGYIIGKGYGENYRAKVCTDGILELMDICAHLKCEPKDVLSYGGIGDIMLSCSSRESRNFGFGLALATKKDLAYNASIEGIGSAKILYNKCKKYNLYPQILGEVSKIIDENYILPDKQI